MRLSWGCWWGLCEEEMSSLELMEKSCILMQECRPGSTASSLLATSRSRVRGTDNILEKLLPLS